MLVVKRGGRLQEFSLDKLIASVPHIAKAERGDPLATYRVSLTASLAILERLEEHGLDAVSSCRLRGLVVEELIERGH